MLCRTSMLLCLVFSEVSVGDLQLREIQEQLEAETYFSVSDLTAMVCEHFHLFLE